MYPPLLGVPLIIIRIAKFCACACWGKSSSSQQKKESKKTLYRYRIVQNKDIATSCLYTKSNFYEPGVFPYLFRVLISYLVVPRVYKFITPLVVVRLVHVYYTCTRVLLVHVYVHVHACTYSYTCTRMYRYVLSMLCSNGITGTRVVQRLSLFTFVYTWYIIRKYKV